jgi:hypothetical protein
MACSSPSACLLPFLWIALLCDALECRQRLCPEAVEIAAQSFEAVRVDRIDTTSSFRTIEDQTRSLQHPQMLGDGGAGDWKLTSQLTHGTRAFHESLEDGATGAITQSGPRVYFVSYH